MTLVWNGAAFKDKFRITNLGSSPVSTVLSFIIEPYDQNILYDISSNISQNISMPRNPCGKTEPQIE